MSELSELFGELSAAAKEDKKKQQEQKPVSELAKEFENLIVEARADKKVDDKVSPIDTSSDFSSLMQELASVAKETKNQITEVAEEYQVEIEEVIPEPVIENAPVSIETQEVSDLIQDSVSALSQINEAEKSNVPVSEISELQARVEQLQKQFGELNSIGWGQRGMDYGSGEVRLEYLDDVDRSSVKTDGYYLKYQASTGKWIGSVSTSTGWDPSGYEYTGDKTLEAIVNEAGSVNGLEIEEDTWTKMPCTGAVGATPGEEDNKLPSSFTNRIWDRSTNRFSFAEIPVDGVVLFRINVDVFPETNNALIKSRIRFVAVNDGTEHVLNEDGDRIVLEDGTGNITGDYFQAYSFFQTVAAQEMNDGAGVETERTFIFPIYVGNSSAQRGWGQFELNCSCDFTLDDSSVLAVLN
tara:strand:- start:675 stop:1907 length:1233 start_codon:yes stop_codon:yes gene_type:complete